ncbi:hypothetical protein K488DRAFT_43091 [Vararia minispora EC-137]|uniref:Uncharacterized protein n=1 Tax=Vararia minispora EC-137 TaxID=1314806 RepID=A0ACB8QV30_9AGAM|nr:hypothetical protein K488DRAFT_43091 [Vararia minispora EC-137]
MSRIRLRHPTGVTTLTIDLDSEQTTVQDLLNQIFSSSEIPPSQQELKVGYPPRALEAVIPELPISSLGLKNGDQITVTQKTSSTPAARPAAPPLPSDPGASIINHPASAPLVDYSTRPKTAYVPRGDNAPGSNYVRVEGGYLIHTIVPDDNSCMFASIALVLEQDMSQSPKIRKIVADAILDDPETWSEAILGRPPSEYISTILSPNSWGGAIELAILATHYATEINSIDVETGRIDQFEPRGAASGNRVLLIYSGIHYDAAILAPEPGAPVAFCTSVFPVVREESNDAILQALQELAGKLRKKHLFTNTATFDLKCEDCGTGLRGEKEAREHARVTGHVKFGEYN